MIGRRRAGDGYGVAVRRRPPVRADRQGAVGEAQRERARRARGLGARHGRARGVLDERVAALERALRVVRVERERSRSSSRRAARAGGGGRALERRRVGADAASRRARRPRTTAPARARSAARRRRAGARASRARARALARSSRSCWCSRVRWRATCSAGARESRGERPRALARSRGGPGAPAARRARAAAPRAARAVDGHGGLGGVRRRRAGDRGDVVDQRPVGVVADRGDHRHAQQRDRAAQRLVAEREQVGERAAAAGDDHDLDLLAARRGPAARA